MTIITCAHRNIITHTDSFKVLIEDTSRLLMVSRLHHGLSYRKHCGTDNLAFQKGVVLPAGHYSVSDTSSSGRTVLPSTTPLPAQGSSAGVSTENTAMAMFCLSPFTPAGEITLMSVKSMYNIIL